MLERFFCFKITSWRFFQTYECPPINVAYVVVVVAVVVVGSPCRLPPVTQWPPFCGLEMKPLGYSYLQNEIL